jgi:hypothetical protein
MVLAIADSNGLIFSFEVRRYSSDEEALSWH